MFKVKKILNSDVYYSDILDAEHFFTSRNLIVKDNIEELSNYLNIDKNNLKHPHQVHSANIEIAKAEIMKYDNIDALIVDSKNIAVYLNFADCTPIILYDTKNNIGAVVHAGWRGTAQKIAVLTALKMQKIYNTDPKNIVAVIGPCISFDCFETSAEAIQALYSTVQNPKGLFKGNFADLKNINKRQLTEFGVKNIDICPYCTVKDNDKFFSYRKENKTKLRHSAVLKIN